MCQEKSKPTDERTVEKKVADWIDASGRSIEMTTAHAARAAGGVAIQSVPYVDPVEGKERETDVVAEFEAASGPNCPVTLVIECKKAPGQHWVTFPYDRGRISSTPVRHHALIDPNDFQRAGRLERAWENGPTIFGPEPVMGSGLIEALRKPKSGKADEGDLASKALRQVWSAAQAMLVDEDMTRLLVADNDGPITRIIVPVIVTGARLWECRLNDDGKPVVHEVDYLRVRTPSTGSAVLVHVMKSDRFTTFAQDLAALQDLDDPAWGPGGAHERRRPPRATFEE